MAEETMLVRLKPFNKKKGHVLRRYTYRGIRFDVNRGWSRVERPVAQYLRDVRQVSGDQDSPPAFDVCTESEARALDEKEAEAARVSTPAEKATRVSVARSDAPGAADLTTNDLPSSPRGARSEKKPRK